MDTRRFNSPEYKRQIQSARAYRRPVVAEPGGGFEKFLDAVGLGSISRRILFFVILAAAVYVVYFAPFMVLRAPHVSGAQPQTAADIQGYFRSYISGFDLLPQRNLLFFSSSKFAAYVTARDPKIAKVVSVSRKPWRNLEVTVIERVPAYNFQAQGQNYVLNSDGALSEALAVPDQNLPLVLDSADEAVSPGQAVLDASKMNFVNFMRDNFARNLPPEQVDRFEIPGVASDDLLVVTKNQTMFYFDPSTDPKLMLSRLLSLWNLLTPDQRQRLAYIDMRFDPKAYGCYKTDKCANANAQATGSAATSGQVDLTPASAAGPAAATTPASAAIQPTPPTQKLPNTKKP